MIKPEPANAHLFRAYVLDTYEAAARTFAMDPSADAWMDLKIAMWAWQFVHAMTVEEMSVNADKFLRGVAAEAKGDANFGES